jgi:hypothetical protein
VKTKKYVSQDGRFPDRYSNQAPSEQNAKTLPLHQPNESHDAEETSDIYALLI